MVQTWIIKIHAAFLGYGMFAQQKFSPRAVAGDESIKDGMMLLMGKKQEAKSGLQIFLVKGNRCRRNEGHDMAAGNKIIQQ